jgi:hypothetical protein
VTVAVGAARTEVRAGFDRGLLFRDPDERPPDPISAQAKKRGSLRSALGYAVRQKDALLRVLDDARALCAAASPPAERHGSSSEATTTPRAPATSSRSSLRASCTDSTPKGAGDFDHDGFLDLAMVGDDQNIAVLFGLSVGFSAPTFLQVDAYLDIGTAGMTARDFNGDGFDDFAVTVKDGVAVFLSKP